MPSASICLPGTSQPIPGKATEFYLTGGALALLAQALGIGWLAEVIAYVSGINFVLSDICSNDPPPDPGMTAQDVACLFSFNPLCDTGASLAKLAQLIEHLAWYQWCQCVGATTPTAPSPPSAPSGLTTLNPTSIIGSGSNTQCFDAKVVNVGPFTLTNNYTTVGLPGTDTSFTTFGNPANPPSQIARPIPPPIPKQVQYTVTVHTEGAHAGNYSFLLNAVQSNNGANCNPSGRYGLTSIAPGQTASTPVLDLCAGIDVLQWQIAPSNVGTQTNTVDLEIKFFCSTNANGGVNTLGCCPTPVDVSSMVQDVRNLVTLVQRYLLPFAYVNGATHSGLTGAASFAISRLLGVHVSLTTIPNYIGVEINTPNALFDVGWISAMDGDGTIHQVRITHQDMVWMPRHFQECTTFGYHLNPGVVASVTELQAEP